MHVRSLKVLAWPVLIAGQLSCNTGALAERIEASEWLNRMGAAVQTMSYEGTVILIQDGAAESLKVVHTVSDGIIKEKVVAQDGNSQEIIRNGNEVHCILPDSKSVIVEEWDDQSTLFSTLPSSEVRFGSEYDTWIVREERVAGRQAVVVAIQPHDGYRYGHRIWLDVETAFPLKTKLVGTDGKTIEEVMFGDIALNQNIEASALEPTMSLDDFQWLTEPARHASQAIDTEWASDDLPLGFKAISTHAELLPGSEDVATTHILFSDGLANVSVFVAPAEEGDAVPGAWRVGGSNSFSTVTEGHRVTAVGEVPDVTVEQIATTMRPRPGGLH